MAVLTHRSKEGDTRVYSAICGKIYTCGGRGRSGYNREKRYRGWWADITLSDSDHCHMTSVTLLEILELQQHKFKQTNWHLKWEYMINHTFYQINLIIPINSIDQNLGDNPWEWSKSDKLDNIPSDMGTHPWDLRWCVWCRNIGVHTLNKWQLL